MNPDWLFVIATVIAVIGIYSAFTRMIHQVQERLEKGKKLDLESLQSVQTKFFIQVAIAESVPILIIVYAFTLIGEVVMTNPLIPMIIILGIIGVATVGLLRLRKDVIGQTNNSQESVGMINTLFFIGAGLLSAIPIISIVGIMTASS